MNLLNKVGIMGGTFNPIHNGHIALAQSAYKTLALDKVLFMPSGKSYMKNRVLDARQRIAMIDRAISPYPYFELSTIEVERAGNTYTSETLRLLNQQNPQIHYYFIMGADSLFHIETWKDPEIIFSLSTLVCAVRDEYDNPNIGVIESGAKVAAAQTRNKRVGVIGTVGTVGSGIHAEYLKNLDPEITVFGKACPLFVPLVEEGWLHDPVTDEIAARYLKELQDKKIDTLILGCTHYPLLRSTIRKIMGEDVCLVNPAYETALELGRLLEEKGLSSTGMEKKDFPYRFFVSDLADEFKAFANSILPYDVEMTKKIDIEKY